MATQTLDYDALAQCTDTSWGRSSTPRTASQSVKVSLLGSDRMLVSYAVLVNFGTEKQMIEMKRRYEDEARSVTQEYLKRVKADYKELTGETLKAKELSTHDNLEIVNFNVHNPRRTAYYRRRIVYVLG